MKSLVLVALIGAIHSPSFAQTKTAHPLEGAIASLSQTANSLNADMSKVTDARIKEDMQAIAKRISGLTRDSLLVSVKKSNEEIYKLGFSLTTTGAHSMEYKYTVAESPYFESLRGEAFAFNIERWKQLQRLVQQDQQSAQAVSSLLEKSNIQQTLDSEDAEKTEFVGGTGRLEALESIRAKVDGTISCVTYMPNALKGTGLTVVAGKDGSAQWSEEDLKSKYGVSTMDALSAKQKIEVVENLNKFMSLYYKYGRYCVNRKVSVFAEQERNRIRDAK